MMASQHIVITASGNSNPIQLDRYVNGYALSVTMKTAGIVYTLQYSLDDPTYDARDTARLGIPTRYTVGMNASAAWFNWDDPLLVAASTNRSTNLAYAPTAVRISVSSKVSAGNPLLLNIIPLGMDGN